MSCASSHGMRRVGGGLLLAIVSALPAFALDPSRAITQYTRRTWTREDGLPQNSVQAIAQTADGYLWVGTQEGLARFDGVRFVPFELRARDGSLDGNIGALYADGEALWVGAGSLYRLEGGRLVEVRLADGSSVEPLRILRDRSKRLWVVAQSGLFTVSQDVAHPFQDPGGLSFEKAVSIAESRDGRLCVAAVDVFCLDGGLFRRTGRRSRGAIWSVAFDASGALFAGSSADGLFRVAGDTVERVKQQTPILALLADRAGSVWFPATPLGAIGRYGPRRLEVLAPRPGAGDDIRSLFEDREGNLWIGTNAGGLDRLSAPPFVTFSSAEGVRAASVHCVLEDHQGVVWVGTAGGLHRIRGGRAEVEPGLAGKTVHSLLEDRQGRLWVSVVGAGVFVRKGARFVSVEAPGRIIAALHQDRQGRIWAGTSGNGVVRLENGKFIAVRGLENVNATAFVTARSGDVWAANAFGGVVRWREGEVTRFGKKQGVPGRAGVALHEDSEGVLWIGMHLGGLTRMADGRTVSFGTAQGLCDDSVFSIVEDSGLLWMSSNRGVFAVPKDELEAVAAGRARRVSCRLFGTADGMRSSECNGGTQPSAIRDRSGGIWFATVDGAVRVDPKAIAALAPPVVLEELVARGRTYISPDARASVEVPPARGGVSVRYTSLALGAAERTRFRYRLDGADTDWVEAGDRRVAEFGQLPSGRYRFRVQAQVPGSPWSEPGASASFRLTPLFSETWWFRGLVALGLAGVVFAGHLTRTAALRRRQRWLESEVEARTQELAEVNATLERRVEEGIAALRESDRMAAFGHLVAGVAHEVRHPIFALRTAAHLLKQKLAGTGQTSEELGILDRETDRMNRLVDDLLELGRPRPLERTATAPAELIEETLASFGSVETPGVAIEKEIEDALPRISVDRAAMVQVLLNLLHNACRHAQGLSKLVVSARGGDGVVRLSVADDGAGIPLKDQAQIFEPFFSTSGSTGLGLAIAQRLVREHGGRISVSSTPGAGTTFTIELPLHAAPGSPLPPGKESRS